ncbi:MAG: fatty acid CoA ligase family protein [Planctomycetota bacterium]
MTTAGKPNPVATATPRCNVADRLAVHAAERPDSVAVVAPQGGGWRDITFAAIDADATRLARGLVAIGVRPGHRIALLVKPGIEFVTLVFALLRSGATMVLVDAGLGRKNIVRCLKSTSPDGFVAIPQGHLLRVLMRKKFPDAKLNVTVGKRWFWRGETLASLRKLGERILPSPSGGGAGGGGEAGNALPEAAPTPALSHRGREQVGLPHTAADDPAAIVFTSGSTGPPKGVLYRHETFATQCEQIQRQYDLQPGAVDLACFPLFGLFNVACGVTTVLPEMDFSRPASCDPKKLFAAANDWKVSQSFASPAVWDRLSRHAEQTGERIPTLRKVFSCGAPVPANVIRRTLAMVAPDAELHTPYGATEALPVATIEAQEILEETAAKTDEGAGVCVGRKFDNVEWRVIRITDDPIATIDETEELPQGEIGELIVRALQVSREYLTPAALLRNARGAGNERPPADAVRCIATRLDEKTTHNELAKIIDGDTIWHRMGDVGYLDDQDRFWCCGRKSQRVVTIEETLYTECVEAIFNTTNDVGRCALVGVGPKHCATPVLVVERPRPQPPKKWRRISWKVSAECLLEFASSHRAVSAVRHFLQVWALPTDIRHNSKINREQLAEWAVKQLAKRR